MKSPNTIPEILHAVKIVLVFASVFLDLLSRHSHELLREGLPSPAEVKRVQRLRGKLKTTLWTRAVPLFVGLCLLCYLMLPAVTFAIQDYDFGFLTFDPIPRLVLLVFLGMNVLLVLSGRIAVLLLQRIKAVKASKSGKAGLHQ